MFAARSLRVPSLDVEGRTVIIKGKWLRIASVRGDSWMEGEVIPDPETFFHSLKQAPTSIDLFTFAQKLPDTAPWPARSTPNGKTWPPSGRTGSRSGGKTQTSPQETRKNVRRAGRRGVVVQLG